jgi:hypothetical protein
LFWVENGRVVAELYMFEVDWGIRELFIRAVGLDVGFDVLETTVRQV